MRRLCLLPLFIGLGGCVDTIPVRHMQPTIATASCGPLSITVDGKRGTLVNEHAWLHHTLVNGAYDESLAVYFTFETAHKDRASSMQIFLGGTQPAEYALRLFDERDQVASIPAAVLPGSRLEKGGTIRACLGPSKLVVPPPLGQPAKGNMTVEISGRIDTVIDDVSTHVPGSK